MSDGDARALFGAGGVPRTVPGDPYPPLFSDAAYAGCAVLWQEPDGLDAAERAALIFSGVGREAGTGLPKGIDMPAACFLAGTCSSAFHLAWRLSRDGLLPMWGSVLASRQETGYGQFRRNWHSPRGNLHVCFRLPAVALFRSDAAAVVLGLLVCGVLRQCGFPLSLKWPNDLLVEQRAKVGGMLVEERDGIVIAGLGINTAEAPGEELLREGRALPAAALACPVAPGSAEHYCAPFSLWRILLSGLIASCGVTAGKKTPAECIDETRGLLAWTGRRVMVDDGGPAPITGRILGCGPGGGLRLLLDDGGERELYTGALSLPS
jgi:BirA family biotin operon repressor/biotin-[acetyl-CoA-carboxylase] ligase